jgi:hypothetical protein
VPHGRLVLPLVPCAHEYPLPCFLIVNDELSRPRLTKLSYKCSRVVKRFHGLDEMEVSVALHLEDTKGQAQLSSDLGTTYLGDRGEIIARIRTYVRS